MTEENNKSGVDVGSESITYIQTGKSAITETARNEEPQKIDRGEARQDAVRNEELQKNEAEFSEVDPSLGTAYFENFEEPGKFRSITSEIEGKVKFFSKISKIALISNFCVPFMLGAILYLLAILRYLFQIEFDGVPEQMFKVTGIMSIMVQFTALLFSILAYMTKKTRDTKDMLFVNFMIMVGVIMSIITLHRLLSVFGS